MDTLSKFGCGWPGSGGELLEGSRGGGVEGESLNNVNGKENESKKNNKEDIIDVERS